MAAELVRQVGLLPDPPSSARDCGDWPLVVMAGRFPVA